MEIHPVKKCSEAVRGNFYGLTILPLAFICEVSAVTSLIAPPEDLCYPSVLLPRGVVFICNAVKANCLNQHPNEHQDMGDSQWNAEL